MRVAPNGWLGLHWKIAEEKMDDDWGYPYFQNSPQNHVSSAKNLHVRELYWDETKLRPRK